MIFWILLSQTYCYCNPWICGFCFLWHVCAPVLKKWERKKARKSGSVSPRRRRRHRTTFCRLSLPSGSFVCRRGSRERARNPLAAFGAFDVLILWVKLTACYNTIHSKSCFKNCLAACNRKYALVWPECWNFQLENLFCPSDKSARSRQGSRLTWKSSGFGNMTSQEWLCWYEPWKIDIAIL